MQQLAVLLQVLQIKLQVVGAVVVVLQQLVAVREDQLLAKVAHKVLGDLLRPLSSQPLQGISRQADTHWRAVYLPGVPAQVGRSVCMYSERHGGCRSARS